jgi:hypothetical protein
LVPRRFFRIALSNPPTLYDLTSLEGRGRLLPVGADANFARLWSGLSVYATEAQAQRKARASPMLGSYLAELNIPETGQIHWERTTDSAGHDTLWGPPAELLGGVVRVIPVRSRTTEGKP